jgi:hypothetical protein
MSVPQRLALTRSPHCRLTSAQAASARQRVGAVAVGLLLATLNMTAAPVIVAAPPLRSKPRTILLRQNEEASVSESAAPRSPPAQQSALAAPRRNAESSKFSASRKAVEPRLSTSARVRLIDGEVHDET